MLIFIKFRQPGYAFLLFMVHLAVRIWHILVLLIKFLPVSRLKIFNNGDMLRDFTYVDDIVTGIENILPCPPEADENGDRYKIYNIGNNKPEKLLTFIKTLEILLALRLKRNICQCNPVMFTRLMPMSASWKRILILSRRQASWKDLPDL